MLDIPEPIAAQVLAIRQRQRDFFRWSLPAETTVSGSSGTGPIATDEDPDRVVRVLDAVGVVTAPIRSSLGPVRRFEGSDVFYLSFADERPLHALHERIASSGLRFEPTPFAFTPHVTVRTAPVSDTEIKALLDTRVHGDFTLDTMSLYQLVSRTPPADRFETLLCLLHRVRLAG